jgi:hypothetical protein
MWSNGEQPVGAEPAGFFVSADADLAEPAAACYAGAVESEHTCSEPK